MKQIDNVWLQRAMAAHDKYSRSIPLGSKSMRCTQEIFVDRYFKFLENRSFKLNIKGKVCYAMFFRLKSNISLFSNPDEKEHRVSFGVKKVLGWSGSEFRLSFLRHDTGFYDTGTLHFNDIMRIRFEEVGNEKFYEILNLFIDKDAPDYEESEY